MDGQSETHVGGRALRLALVVVLHLALIAALVRGVPREPAEVPRVRMEVRTVEEPERAPPPPPVSPRPLPATAAPRPAAAAPPPPVMTAAAPAPEAAPAFTMPVQTATTPVAPVPTLPAAPAAAAPPAPVPVTPARFDADYLQNPAPSYPPVSRRLREEGRVLLLVRVSASGQADAVQVRQSSGFERLDEAAMAAVRTWRFVPAKRGDEAVAASVLVPLVFRLD